MCDIGKLYIENTQLTQGIQKSLENKGRKMICYVDFRRKEALSVPDGK